MKNLAIAIFGKKANCYIKFYCGTHKNLCTNLLQKCPDIYRTSFLNYLVQFSLKLKFAYKPIFVFFAFTVLFQQILNIQAYITLILFILFTTRELE
jgi:hypothetical protein